MDKNLVVLGLFSILIGGTFGFLPLNNSFAQDDNLSVSTEDSEAYQKQLEKAEEERKKAEERKQKLEEKQEKQKQKAEERKQKLEEKQEKQKQKAEERKQKLEEKQEKQKQKAEERKQKLEEKKAKLEDKRKKLEAKQAEKAKKYEDRLRELKERYQNKIESDSIGDVEQFSSKIQKLEDKIEKKSEKIRDNLNKKLDKLDLRTQKIIEKLNNHDYLGDKLGTSDSQDVYTLVFDSVDATSINDKTQSSSLSGIMSFKTFDKGNSNLKLELDECQITVDSIPFNCGFGKARTASSGDSGQKDSLVILAFLEDNVIEDVHSTLKIFLNADVPISEISDSIQVSILSPQSKISHMWFLEGSATLSKSTSILDDEIPDDTTDIPDEDDGQQFTISLRDGISTGAR